MKKLKLLLTVLAVSTIIVGLISCGDNGSGPDGPDTETTFTIQIQNVNMANPVFKSGAFTIPVGASEAGPLFPDDAFEFEFTAPVGAHLSFATMFSQSNDWIFATDEDGIALYDEDGSQVTGDVTNQLGLYDVGTEEDQELGTGPDQAPRQSGPNTGADDDNPNVRLVDDSDLPPNNEMIELTLTSTGDNAFKVRIENVSNNNTLQTSDGGKPVLLSPGTWLVHDAAQSNLLYTLGEADYGDGLEAIAEDGNPGNLTPVIAERTGLTTPLSPPVYAVHEDSYQVFEEGQPAPSGLEIVAEDGFPADMLGGMDLPPDIGLVDMLNAEEAVHIAGAAPNPDGNLAALEPAADGNGESIEFSVTASPGDRLAVFSMFVQSNDLFYAFEPSGISLFDSNGNPISGDVTEDLLLWDAGTEEDEEPGVGPNQKPRQGATALDVGAPENESVNRIANAPTNDFTYPATNQVIRLTIMPTSQQ